MQIDTKPSGKNDWLIIFLVLDTTELTCYISELIVKLKHIQLSQKIKVYFLTDTIQRIKNPRNFPEFQLQVTQLVFDPETEFTVRSQIEINELDKRDGSAWLHAIRLIYEQQPAQFRMLIPWSHASAISLGNFDPPRVEYLTKFNVIRNYPGLKEANHYEALKKATPLRDGLAQIARADIDNSCLEPEQLYISEIASGLNDLVGENKFDFIVMSNCYTQSIDNCYNLSTIARYYVAPMTLISTLAYDFGNLILQINDQPVPATEKDPNKYAGYCQGIIDLLITGFKNESPAKGRGAALIANRIDNFKAIKPLLNALCKYLLDNRTTTYPVIRNMLEDPPFLPATINYVDFFLLFNTLERKLNSIEFTKLFEPIKSFLGSIRVGRHVGSELNAELFNYFSIYIPLKLKNVIDPPFLCQYFRNYFHSDFVKEAEWDNFIVDYTMASTPQP